LKGIAKDELRGWVFGVKKETPKVLGAEPHANDRDEYCGADRKPTPDR